MSFQNEVEAKIKKPKKHIHGEDEIALMKDLKDRGHLSVLIPSLSGIQADGDSKRRDEGEKVVLKKETSMDNSALGVVQDQLSSMKTDIKNRIEDLKIQRVEEEKYWLSILQVSLSTLIKSLGLSLLSTFNALF